MINNDPWNQLTNREIEILQLLAQGWSNMQIADSLCITVRTVKFHTSNIYEKINARTRSEAIAWLWMHREVQVFGDD